MLPNLVLCVLAVAGSALAAPGKGSTKVDLKNDNLFALPLTALHTRGYVPETEAQLKARTVADSITVSCFPGPNCYGTPSASHTYTNTRKYNTQAVLANGPTQSFGSCRFDTTGNYRAYVQLQGASPKPGPNGIKVAPVSNIGTTPPSGSYCLTQNSLSQDPARRGARVVVIGRLGP
ncbi:uncharacterized protein LOC62_02G002291 [Vanrija pseudolonga]|uniref:Uncharacterized protein n=1 Tax=Vanrija pseudolonga TaxID=143232 RepID=A0AAF0Y3I0_9TREE|nr:hypothetical protein LOC62_02G002291 [Vanrija pseudolonga]